MDTLRQMVVFATVVEAGSLRRAGKVLGISTSAVSQHLHRLERELRVTLLNRSTRRVSLTDAGEAFYGGCREVRDAVDLARERVAAARDVPAGELTIGAPSTLAATRLPQALRPLLVAHRQLTLRLLVSDERFDPIHFRLDVAIVVGEVADSALVAHPLATWEAVLCAAPSYLTLRGTPREVADLAAHDLLVLAQDYVPGALEMTGPGGQRIPLGLRGRHVCNNQLTLRRMALDGLGVSVQAAEEIAGDLETGRLVRVLPHWSFGRVPLRALTTSRAHQPARVRLALDALRREFGAPGGDAR